MNDVSIVSVSPPLDRNPKWRHVTIRRGDPPIQERAICFSGGEALVPGPLPDGWTVKESDRGPVVEAPRQARQGGGRDFAAAFRNTKEGHFYEQERMDRRTALMQAVETLKDVADTTTSDITKTASVYYDFLREGS